MIKAYYILYRTFLLIILISAGNSYCYSQTNIDSLKKELTEAKDSARVDLLVQICEFYNSNDARQSICYAKEAIGLAREINYAPGIQNGLHSLAIAYYQQLDYENALKNLREEINYIDVSSNPMGLIRIYNTIGIIYEILGDYRTSVSYHYKGLKLLESSPDLSLFATININLAIDYSSMEMYDSTTHYIEIVNRAINNPDFENHCLKTHIQVYIAELYYIMESYGSAYLTISIALKDKNSLTDKYGLSSLYLVLGKISDVYGKYQEAEESFKKTIVLAQEVGQPRREMEARQHLSELYKKTGRFKLAYSELKRYNKVKDSTTTANKNRHILEIEADFEKEQANKKIELLKKGNAYNESELIRTRLQNLFLLSIALLVAAVFIYILISYKFKIKLNRELKDVNANLLKSQNQLQELNSMKDNLIRIIGHDLKGPLGTVIGFSDLITARGEENNKDVVQTYSAHIYKASLGLTHLLDNILFWAKLQRGNYQINATSFNIRDVIMQGVSLHQLIADNKRISIDIDVNDKMEAYGDSFALSILVGNLLCNAIKFSHFDSVVKIIVSEKQEDFQVTISDEGVGIDKEIQTQLFNDSVFKTTNGTNKERGTGFGLKICKQFVELNGGQIWVESEVDKGSKFHFTIPSKLS